MGDAAAGAATPAGSAGGGSSEGPSGPGLIVQIYGRHYHNAEDAKGEEGGRYVHDTLITALASQKMHDMGVSYPVLIQPGKILPEDIVIPSPKRKGSDVGGPGGPTAAGTTFGGDVTATADKEKKVLVQSFTYRVQFVWQPKSATEQAALPAQTPPVTPPAKAPPSAGKAPPAVAPATPAAPAATRPTGPVPPASGPITAPGAAAAPAAGTPPGPAPGRAPAAVPAPAAPPATGGGTPKP